MLNKFNKVNYVSRKTIIGAENLNNIQDSVLDNAEKVKNLNADIKNINYQLEQNTNKVESIESRIENELGDLDKYVTESELESKGYLTQHQSLTDYAKKSELHSHSNKNILDNITNEKIIEWNNKSTFDGNYNSLTNKPNIPTKLSELTNDNGYITTIPSEYVTESELDSKGYLTEHQDLSHLATESFVKDEIAKAQIGGSGEVDLSAYATKNYVDDEISKIELKEGPQGPKGDKGEQGLPGQDGAQGPVGPVGPQGERGLQGEQGIQGPQGAEGPRGPAGPQGQKGEAFRYEDFTPEQLEALKGPKGDKGERGEQGPKGDKGDKGDTGLTGPQGLQGIQGPKGDKGDRGEQGVQGVNGITPNISIGSVTTLEPGSKPTVTRRGSDATPIFDFGIPKGEQGEQGLAGSSYNDTEIRELISALTKRIDELEKGNIPPIEDDKGVIIEGSYCGQMTFKPINTITMEDLKGLVNRVDVTRPQTIYAHSGDTVYNKTVICAIPKTQWNIRSVIDGAGVDITASYPIIEKEINGTTYIISCNKVAQAYNKSTVVKFNIDNSSSSTPDDDEVVEETIKCTSITLDESSISLSVGANVDKTVIIPTVEPANTTDEIVWTTGNAGIATVSNGIVSAVAGTGGTTTITARCGDQVATCSVKVTTSTGTGTGTGGTGTGGTGTGGASSHVTVFDVLQDEYVFNTTNATDTQTMTPYIKPATSTKARIYKSSNKNIATINSNGVITPISEGECTVYACCGPFVVSSKVIVHIPTKTYNSPTITVENFKAKVEQDGHVEYFDLSYEPNTGHPYYRGYKELTDSNGTRYYLALLNKGTSKFRIDGLIPANGGWMSLSHHNGENYVLTFESALYPQYNNWSLDYDVRIKNNSISQEFVQHALNNVNASFDALNITINDSSKNIMELADFNESFIGLLDFHTPSGTNPAYFEVLLNKSVINDAYGILDVSNKNSDTYRYWLSTAVHEFGHTLGIRDNSTHLPTMYSYSRNLLKCNYLQPNDMYVIRHFWKDMFNKDVPSKRASASKRILAFEYPNYSDNQLANNSDVVVNAKLKLLRVEDINVGGDLVVPYNVYEIVPSEIEKGNLINPELKIYINEKLVIDEDKKYKLYLKQYDNVPCSLINPKQGLEKLS